MQLRQTATAIPNTGFVPYPILTEVTAGEVEPVLAPDGSYQPAWDGTLADLLAADAYADCAVNSSVHRKGHVTQGANWKPELAPSDTYLNRLKSLMVQFSCEPDTSGGWNTFAETWVVNRASVRCNIDPQSKDPAQVEAEMRALNQYADFHDYYLDLYTSGDWEDLVDPDVLAEPFAAQVFGYTAFDAGIELEYADLNLCIAQRLRAELNGGQSLFTPTRDQIEITAVMRERAQLAVLYYSLLAKVLSSPETVPTQIVDNEYQRLAFIRLWAEQAPSSVIQAIGDDYALAVRLQLETTHELASLLERQAATRPINDVGSQLADRDWGLGQPRLRLMNLLYGGDPIGSPGYPLPPGRFRGGVGRTTPFEQIMPAYVRADMDDPRVGSLFGFARAADALLMKVETRLNSQMVEVPIGFEVQPSAERLYRAVETYLRVQTCESETPSDPDCDPEAVEAELPSLTQIDEFRLWQEHRIDLSHSKTLIQAFQEAFGELVQGRLDFWWNHRSFDGRFHLLGAHQTETIDGDSWIHVDPEFGVAPFGGHELMVDFAELAFLPRTIFTGAAPTQQGFVFYTEWSQSTWEQMRSLGAIAVLAYAREAIVEGSEAEAFAEPFFTAVSSALPEIDRAAGGRTVIVRPTRKLVNATCGWNDTQVCKVFSQDGSTNYRREVNVITRPEDPMNQLTLAPESPHLHTVAVDRDSVGFDGVDRADLDGYTVLEAVTHAFSGYASDYERRTFQYEIPDAEARTLYLRGNDPDNSGERIYMSIFDHRIDTAESYATSFGGALNAIGERAMSVLPFAWSRPAYDAFGLPTDWVPPSDASLVGGAPGEPSYQFYLRSARAAAEEGTAAVQKAIDSLVEQTLVGVELAAAEERAASIAEIETRALCGEREDCVIEHQTYRASVDNDCEEVPEDVRLICGAAVGTVNEVLLAMSLATEVVNLAPGVAPVLDDLSGSEVERILIRQWSALQVLEGTVHSASKLAPAVALEIYAARQQANVAEAELAAAQANIDAEIAELDVEDIEVAALISQLQAQANELDAVLTDAVNRAARECSEAAYENARRAGDSVSTARNTTVTYTGGGESASFSAHTDYRGERSWSPGPLYAQAARCRDALDRRNLAQKTAAPIIAARRVTNEALLARGALDEIQREALTAEQAAAEQRRDAVAVQPLTAVNAAWAQIATSLTQVQQAQGEVLAASAELDHALLRTRGAISAATLERDLVAHQTATRYGLQRQFRSYEMWRARALLESARRIAVAARRAIEARFVVDLSALQAQQAFVEAPAVWADEVYASDLDAPSVVGVSATPQLEDTIYPNQLLDYVGNLERFVQGYAVTYPTSVASPDTEVVTLAGPEVTEEVTQVLETTETVEEIPVEILGRNAFGWTFYCPQNDTWVPHPGAGQVPLEDRLATACDGEQPTRMRYNFALDPWARLNDSIGNAPLEQRHNVRWRRLAVNLIGTGVRDCAQAPNPELCYSEGFLPFQLVHAGPAWSMNHSQEWRSFGLPTAFIENGKALAVEEWLDPITNNWTTPYVVAVARGELSGRPVGGGYELIVEISPEVRLERLEQVQLLIETDYWVRQQ